MNFLASLLGGSALSSVNGILGRFFTNKDAVEGDVHQEQVATSTEQATEFQHEKETWFDSLVDGINRLPRPLMAFSVLWLMWMTYHDPATFVAMMTAMSLMPTWLTVVVGQIILLFFGGRMMENWPTSMDPPSMEKLQGVMNTIQEIKQMHANGQIAAKADAAAAADAQIVAAATGSKPVMSDAAYRRAMADTSAPLSNDAIAEWNRRNNPQTNQ